MIGFAIDAQKTKQRTSSRKLNITRKTRKSILCYDTSNFAIDELLLHAHQHLNSVDGLSFRETKKRIFLKNFLAP